MEGVHYFVGLGALARVRPDGDQQVIGAPVMEKEDALADPPQRRGAEFIWSSSALTDVVFQPLSHMV